MLTMTQKTLLGLAITLSIAIAGVAVLPAWSYEVMIVTSPNKDTIFIPAGKPFNITCKGAGDDAEKFSSLQWLNKEGKVIPKGIPGTQETEKGSLTLTFTDPKEDDTGVYKCLALYQKEHTLQKSVSITFHGTKPVFESSFQSITASENTYLEIFCAAEGESPITYEWYNEKEKKILDNSNESIYVSQLSNASVLIIPAVKMENAGMYTCSANNRHGLTSKIFQLMVSEGNDTTNGTGSLREVRVANLTATSVKFRFYLSGPVENIEVLYTESQSKEEHYLKFNYGDNYEIKGLIPAGLYNFKFRTSPSTDNRWSSTYRVILLPEKPEVIFRTINSGTVKFQWFLNYEKRLRNTIDLHEITYFTVRTEGIENKWIPNSCNITIRIPNCNSATYTISDLNQGGYYEIQLRAHTASGFGEPFKQKIYFG